MSMKDNLPLVSVAVITYNQKEYLKECIESILEQDYQNIEIVIADDASTDGTQEMLREYDKYSLGCKKIFDDEVYLSAPTDEEFKEKTKKYLNNILSSKVGLNNSTIVINNVFEPFNPLKSMQFFDNAKSIVIDRDPRDIYLAAWNYTNKDGSKGWKATLGSDVESFIQRFKIYRAKVDYNINKDILRVTFEDLIFKYEQTLDVIFDFIDEDRSIHVNKKKYFDPDISKKGVGMWKNVDSKLKKDIEKIQKELQEYCKDY